MALPSVFKNARKQVGDAQGESHLASDAFSAVACVESPRLSPFPGPAETGTTICPTETGNLDRSIRFIWSHDTWGTCGAKGSAPALHGTISSNLIGGGCTSSAQTPPPQFVIPSPWSPPTDSEDFTQEKFCSRSPGLLRSACSLPWTPNRSFLGLPGTLRPPRRSRRHCLRMTSGQPCTPRSSGYTSASAGSLGMSCKLCSRSMASRRRKTKFL